MKRIVLVLMLIPTISHGVSIPTVYGETEKTKIKELLTELDAKNLNDSIKKVNDLKEEKDRAHELLKLLRSKTVDAAKARINRLKIRSKKCRNQEAEIKKLQSEIESLNKKIETLEEEIKSRKKSTNDNNHMKSTNEENNEEDDEAENYSVKITR